MSAYYFGISALIYMVLITIVFILKKKNTNAENIIFSHLILIGLATVVLDLGCIFLYILWA